MKEISPKFKKILLKTEFRLVLFLAYVGSLIYVWLTSHGWMPVFYVHLFFVFVFSIFYFGPQFLLFLLAPLIAIFLPIQTYFLRRYLKKFKQNIPTEVVVILGRYNWFKLEAWIKPNFLKGEIISLIKLLKTKGQEFSFYPDASFEDVEKIMSNKDVKEVYFFGHGDSHTFQLNTDEILYYCDFNNPKYGKTLVHQVHCGTKHGKSLVDYVISEQNRAKCFLFRKSINSLDIRKEFKRRMKTK